MRFAHIVLYDHTAVNPDLYQTAIYRVKLTLEKHGSDWNDVKSEFLAQNFINSHSKVFSIAQSSIFHS